MGGPAAAWDRFWFTPTPGHALGLVRLAFGVVAVAWTLAALPDVRRVFAADGVVPDVTPTGYRWSVFTLVPGGASGDHALLAGWVLMLAAAVALTVGWHARPAAVVLWILMASFQRRGEFVYNAGDAILLVIGLVLALSCCDRALSLDQRRRTGSFWSAATLAPWPLRLLQVQLTLIYLVSVQAKLSGGKSWVNGSAAFYTTRTDGRWALIQPPDWLFGNAVIVNVATWSTLLIELAVAILVWNRRTRFWALGAGVVLHVVLMITMNVGFFSLSMFVLYAAFVPPSFLRGQIARLAHRRRAAPAPPAPAAQTPPPQTPAPRTPTP